MAKKATREQPGPSTKNIWYAYRTREAMKKILERVQNLIRLSESTSENEARAAALQACKLIMKHKLCIVEPPIEETQAIPSGAQAVGRAVRDVAADIASRVTAEDVVDVVSVLLKRGRQR